MTKQKFYKTVIAIEVLSEEPIPDGMDLGDIVTECMDGGYSMRPLKHKETKINGRQAASALLKHGSDPSFFQLCNNGDDLR